MNIPLKSNLILLIESAIEDCYTYGSGQSISFEPDDDINIEICAEWVESKNEGYYVMNITIIENGVIKFSYDDYGTECPN